MGRFKKPGEVKPDIPRPLSAICLKAMARDPEDRYHSAQALAEDVERFLADEPLIAYREPLYGRIFRWMRKHRSLVVGAAGILTVTAIALTLGVILLGAANRRETEQRQLAEKNFEMARNAVRDYFTSVSEDTLLNQSGMQPLRNQLLSRALTYYEEFLDSGPSSAEMRDELAQANYYVGRIKETIDSPASALPYYEHSIAFSDDLLGETPGDRQRLDQLADTLNAQGRALQKLGRLDHARGAYARAGQLRQRLVDASPEDAEFARQLANTIMNMGTLEVMSGDHHKGIPLWERAQELRREHLTEDARLPKLLRDYGQGSFNFGNLRLELNELDAAREQLEIAIASFEKLIEIEPDDMEAQLNLALAFRVLGDVAPIDDGIDPALNYYQRAIDYLAALALRNPQVPRYRADLAGTRITIAQLLLEDAQLDPAALALVKPIESFEALVEQYADVPSYRSELAFALQLRGETLIDSGEVDGARRDLQRAREQLEKLAAQFPTDGEYGERLNDIRATMENLDNQVNGAEQE